MKKLIVFICMLVLGVNSFSLEIKDNKIYGEKGYNIQLKEYKRVIAIDPAVVETMYLLGAEDRIVGIAGTNRSKIWPYDKTPKLTSVGNTSKPNIEKIISLEPDLVIVNGMSLGIAETLRTKNIPVLVNDTTKDFGSILDSIKIYGEIFNKKVEAEKLYAETQKKIDNLKEIKSLKKGTMRGMILYSTSPMMGFDAKSLPGQILDIIGIENITVGLKGSRPIISPEYLLAKNPNIIIGAMSINSADDIVNANPFVKETDAAKNKSIFIVDSAKVLRGSPRIFDAIEELYGEIEKCQNSK